MNNIINELVRSADYFYEDERTRDEVRVRVIREAFNNHKDANKYYKCLCEDTGKYNLSLESVEDLNNIPLIDIKEFKSPESAILLSTSLKNIVFEMRSTGTSGVPSISRRDNITCNNALAYINGLYREFFELTNGAGLFFSTSLEEMPEMGMVKALNFVNGYFDTHEYMVQNVSFNFDKSLENLQKWENKFTRHILGAPFLLNSFLDYLKMKDIKLKLDKNSKIITIGGWKRYTGIQISREELNRKCEEFLGIKPSQIRDMYGLVECNTLAIECEYNKKHIPSTTYMSIRDIENPKKIVEDGKHGLVAIMDPSSNSYPGFILTEDIGVIEKNYKCECGRCSDIIKIIGRAPKAETGCCAVRLERQIEESAGGDN